MTHKFNINPNIRTIYVSEAGVDSDAGTNLETSKKTVAVSMTTADALTPATGDPVAIADPGASTYAEDVVVSDNVFMDMINCRMVGAGGSGTTVTGGANATAAYLTIQTNGGSGGVAFSTGGKSRMGLVTPSIILNGTNQTAILINGSSNQIFLDISQILSQGIDNTLVSHISSEAQSSFTFNEWNSSENGLTGLSFDSTSSDAAEYRGGAIRLTGTGTTGIHGINGNMAAYVNIIQAEDAIIVESGMIVSIFDADVVGDITINAGGTLNCTINSHDGELINNGTLIGRIGNKFYRAPFEIEGDLDVNGQIQIQGGAPGVDKVLTSDANGLATWETAAASETFAETLANGNATGGNDIVITNGDVIRSADDAPLFLVSGFGINGAGDVIISVGVTDDGKGGDWRRTAGPGGTEGGNAPGGDIVDTSGSGNSNQQRSGHLRYFAGNPDGATYGTMFWQQNGGNATLGADKIYADKLTVREDSSSSATNIVIAIINENTTDNNWAQFDFKGLSSTGSVFTGARIGIQILDHNNSTKSADYVIKTTHNNILSERLRISDGVINVPTGKFSIGAGADPLFKLDVESNATGNLLRVSANIGNSAAVLAINSERTTAGNVGIINFTHNDVAVSQILGIVTNEPNNFGGLKFFTKGAGGFLLQMDIDEDGVLTSRGELVSRIAPQTIEIFTASQLDDLATAGVITVSTQTAFILKANITTSNRFDVQNAPRFTIGANGEGYSLTYDDADTFITSVDSIIVIETSLTATGGGTLFDISGQIGTIINIDFTLFSGWKMGAISRTPGAEFGPDVFFLHMSSLNWQDTLTLENVSVLTIDEVALIPFAGAGVPFVEIKGGAPGSYTVNLVSGSLAAGESLMRIDPGISSDSKVFVSGTTASGTLFDTTGGTTGTFTAVGNPNSISPTAITGVDNDGGFAKFLHAGTDPSIGEQAILTTFSESTYNDIGVVTTVDAGVGFTVGSIEFAGTDTGSFETKTITVTSAAHGLPSGQTLILDSDLSTDYGNGGFTVFNVQTNTFDCSDTFIATQTGAWDTAGIDQADPRVLANNNTGLEDSITGATGESHAGAATTTIQDGVYVPIQFDTFVSSAEQRLKHLGNGKYEVTSKEPVRLNLSGNTSQFKSGATVRDYRFAIAIDDNPPVYNVDPSLSDPYEDFTATSDPTKIPINLVTPLLITSQTFQLYVAGQGNTDDLVFINSSLIWS